MPFFRDGLEHGEKVVHIVGNHTKQEHLCACQRYGIDTDRALSTGQFELLHWEATYLHGGRFEPDRMVDLLEITLDRHRARYGRTRLMGTMEWSLQVGPAVTDLIEYEARVNEVSARHPDPLICVYDLNKHPGHVILDVLRTHPMVIINGLLQDNPLFVPPQQFLEELRARNAGRDGI